MKMFLVLMISISLFGCKVTTQAIGVWYGAAVDGNGNVVEAVLFVNEKGGVYITVRDGFFLFGNSEVIYIEDGGSTEFYTSALSSGGYGSLDPAILDQDRVIDIKGVLGDQTGSIELSAGDDVLYTLTLIRDQSSIAKQSDYEGEWRIDPEDPSSVDTWTISSDGILNGVDPLGCVYTGYVNTLDSVNIADLLLVVKYCQYSGIYTGVMSLFLDPSDPTQQRKGIFYHYGNSKYVFVNGLETQL